MKLQHLACIVVICGAATAGAAHAAADLPGDYFKVMIAEVKNLEGAADLRSNQGAMLSAAVLYTKQHPANPFVGDKKNSNWP